MTDQDPRARDLMQSDVISLSPETELLDIHRLFVEEEIHGAPVVDDDGNVRGVVSTLDILRTVRDELESILVERPQSTASDAMTKELVTVGLDATIEEIARTMLDQHVHRVLVTDGGILQGVITTFDLLRVLVGHRPKAELDPALVHATGYHR
jgi:predicted transcriptional regulator